MGLVRAVTNRFLHVMARQLPGATSLRPRLHRWRGVNVGSNVFIGDDVYLENEYPERVEIHDGAQISIRAIVLAHTRGPGWVVIEKDAYVGPNTVVVTSAGNTLRIGEGAVVGAGVVITKSVPPRAFIPPQPANPIATVTVPLAKAERIEDFIRGLVPMRTRSQSADGPRPPNAATSTHETH
jgi:UDP-3-O-[3-hydroxymyristoyl] glucosamine N-acyltransferase